MFSQGPQGPPRMTTPASATEQPAATPPPRVPGTSPGPGRDLPAYPPTTPATSPTEAEGDAGEAGDAGGGFLGFGTGRRDRRARRTRTSTTTDGPTAKDVATALAGLLAVIAGVSAWMIRLSSAKRWDLREPDDAEVAKVADPLARILERHFDSALLTPDLVDGVAAAAGVAAYVRTDPLYRANADPPAEGSLDPDLTSHGYQEP